MRKQQWHMGLFVLFLALVLMGNGPAQPEVLTDRGCNISSWGMSPSDPYTLGVSVQVYVESDCGTTRFTVDGDPFGEDAMGSQRDQWDTSRHGAGTHEFCAVARGEGGWENADRECRTVYVEGGQAPPPGSQPGDNVKCWVENFYASPNSVPVGDNIRLSAQGQCDGNMRATAFTIDGRIWGESSLNTRGENWGTTSASVGSHKICFMVTAGDWSEAAKTCLTVSVTTREEPPSTEVESAPPSDNGQPGQTAQSGPGQNAAVDSGLGMRPSLDMTGWCLTQGFGRAEYIPGDAFSWVCVKAAERLGVDEDAVCRQDYGDMFPYAELQDPNDPLSWYCTNVSDEASVEQGCPSAPARLEAGDIAFISDYDPYDVNIRSEPSVNARILESVPVREQLTIVGGFECHEGYRWYQVGYNGITGWAAEVGTNGLYNLVPNDASFPNRSSNNGSRNEVENSCPGAHQLDFHIGGQGRVVPDGSGAVSLRSAPQQTVLRDIPEGGVFEVVGGPVCSEARHGYLQWWKVRHEGTIGWVPTGYSSESPWIEPHHEPQSNAEADSNSPSLPNNTSNSEGEAGEVSEPPWPLNLAPEVQAWNTECYPQCTDYIKDYTDRVDAQIWAYGAGPAGNWVARAEQNNGRFVDEDGLIGERGLEYRVRIRNLEAESPQAGDIMVTHFSKTWPYGHVAYVESYSEGILYISESNVGSENCKISSREYSSIPDDVSFITSPVRVEGGEENSPPAENESPDSVTVVDNIHVCSPWSWPFKQLYYLLHPECRP